MEPRCIWLACAGLALAMSACSDDDERDPSAVAGRSQGGASEGGWQSVLGGAAASSSLARFGGAAGTGLGTGASGAVGTTDSPRSGGVAGSDVVSGGNAGTASGGVAIGGAGCAIDPVCDDGNPCTSDCRSAGSCHSLPLDGTPCDDGLLCTSAERCVQGTCRGTTRDAAGEVTATVSGYGGAGFLISAFLSDELLAIGENVPGGARLSLLRIRADGLELVDQVIADGFPLRAASVSYWVWDGRPAAHLVALGEGRLALVGGNSVSGVRVDLFQVKDDQLEKLAQSGLSSFSPDEGGPRSASGHGNTLWVCSASETGNVQKYVIRSDGTVDVLAGRSIPVQGMGACRGTVLSRDGTRLFVSGDRVLAELDVSGETPILRQALAIPGRILLDMQVTSDHVALRTVDQLSKWGPTGLGDVKVVRRDDFTKTVASHPVEGARGTLLDFALMESGLMLREGVSTGCEVDLRLYDLATGAVKSAHRSPATICLANSTPLGVETPFAKAFGTTVLGFSGSDVFRLDPTDSTIRPLTAPGHGGLQHVFPIGQRQAMALGLDAATVLDFGVSTGTPLALGGRIVGPFAQQQLALPAARLVENQCPFKRESSLESRLISIVQMPNQGLPTVKGSLRVEGSVAVSQHELHSVTRGAGNQFRFRSFPLSQVTAASEQNLAASAEQSIDIQVPDGFELAETQPFQIGVDRRGREIVMAGVWGNASGVRQLGVAWVTREDVTSDVQTAFVPSKFEPRSPNDIGVFGKATVIVTADSIWLARRTASSVTVTSIIQAAERSPEVTAFGGLLGFDGETVAVGASWKVLGSRIDATGVLVLRLSDSALIGLYPSEERAVSLAEVGDRWVVGSCNSVSVIPPSCRATGVGGWGGQGGAGGQGGTGNVPGGSGNAAGAGGTTEGADGGGGEGSAGGSASVPVLPWVGELVQNASGQVLCGGSLLSERWWLTAAECVVGRDVSSMSVRLGVSRRNAGTTSASTFGVLRSVAHPSYDAGTRDRDLALLELANAANADDSVCPIAIASMTANTGDSASLIGWGSARGTGSAELGAEAGTVRSPEICAAAYDRATVFERLVCLDIAASATCRADLGGAMASRATLSSPWQQVGLVSWVGPECKQAVVTPLSTSDLDWIAGTAGPLPVLGDVDGDHLITLADVEGLAAFVGTAQQNCHADVNQDGIVDTSDYDIVMERFIELSP